MEWLVWATQVGAFYLLSEPDPGTFNSLTISLPLFVRQILSGRTSIRIK
jgi:hypothetical protein